VRNKRNAAATAFSRIKVRKVDLAIFYRRHTGSAKIENYMLLSVNLSIFIASFLRPFPSS